MNAFGRIPVAILIVLALCPGIPAAMATDDASPRILVTFADPGLSNASRAGPIRPGYSRRSGPYLVAIGVRRAADRIARDFDLRIVDEWPIVPLAVHCLVYALGEDDTVDAVLERLRQRPEVESAQRMHEFEVLGAVAGSEPYAALQHTVDTLELQQAHSWSRGAGSSVTIIDTGADFRHPELVTQVEEHVDFVGDVVADVMGAATAGELPADVDARDRQESVSAFLTDAHGTAVAGIIGAASDNGIGMVGIAPSARLRLLKACWYDDADATRAVCNSFTLAKALSHAIETAPQVINLSLGGPPDALLARLVGVALAEGATVVTAAPPGAGDGFPANVAGVIVVTGSAVPGRLPIRPLLAPGYEILVPVPGGGYDYASGSSLAAAHVSGIAALLVARQPDLSGTDVADLLVASRGDDREYVNACRALAELLKRSGCRDDATVRADARPSEAGGETDDPL